MKLIFARLMRILGVIAVLLSFGAVAESTNAADKIKVVSVNYPLHYFAERIATDAFELEYLVDEDIDPAFWKPNDEALLAFQKADVILRNGADYAKWMKVVTLPTTTMVNTSKSFSDRYLKTEGKEHQHGNGEVHSHAGTAFTTWVDMSLAAEQAKAIAKRFAFLAPAEKGAIQGNLETLLGELTELDEAFKNVGNDWSLGTVIASHPVYHYFAEAYGIEIESLEWEPEMKLGAADKKEFKEMTKAHKSKVLFWEGTPSEENAAFVEAAGLRNVVFDPCGNRSLERDWLAVMKENLAALQSLSE